MLNYLTGFSLDNQLTNMHDTNDYETFPNFECTHQPIFMTQYLSQLPPPTVSYNHICFLCLWKSDKVLEIQNPSKFDGREINLSR